MARNFQEAALALITVIAAAARVECSILVEIECSAPDPELLLCDWLDALRHEMALGKMLFARFDVTMEEELLRSKGEGRAVEVRGPPIPSSRFSKWIANGWLRVWWMCEWITRQVDMAVT